MKTRPFPVRSLMAFGLVSIFLMPGIHQACGQARLPAKPAEPLLRRLPPGVIVVTSTEVPAGGRDAIGAKLGGRIARLTNSTVRVHGRPIQVNVIAAADEPSADALWAALNRIKQPPFLVRKGREIVEYVASDDALARKTTWELGLEPKPKAVRYRVMADLAAVDLADDMSANPLFQACLEFDQRKSPATEARIAELAAKFGFGTSLTLRDPAQGGTVAVTFTPEPQSRQVAGSSAVYRFADPPRRHGIPYARAVIESTAAEPASEPKPNGVVDPDPAQRSKWTATTPRWPADDPKIRDAAGRITEGLTDPEAKVAAILAWLAPGKNVRYEGQTGSRWGTLRALEQKYGHCWDFSDLFVTLARSAGVPTRQVAGWLYGTSGHVWAEWFAPGRGWVPVDPTGGGVLPCGIYHIPYFTTDDGEMPIVYLSMPKVEIVETR